MTRQERWTPPGRQGAVRSALLIALAALLAGCAAPTSSPAGPSPANDAAPVSPTRICDGAPEGAGLLLSCTEAIGGVLLALGPEARSVTAAWFRPGAPCPPNARCIAPPPGSAYVIFRLENGRVGLVRFAGESFAAEPEVPTYDVWPASGVPVPPVGRPDVGPGAPAEISNRDPLPLCGEEQVGVTESRLERSCFFGAVKDGRPAEFVSRSVDDRGDPFLELYRFSGRGPVLVYRSASIAGAGWVRNDCAIGSAFDDAAIFVVNECLTTGLP